MARQITQVPETILLYKAMEICAILKAHRGASTVEFTSVAPKDPGG